MSKDSIDSSRKGASSELRSGGVSAAERAEREEMFGFHPEILAEAGALPRKVGGGDYTNTHVDTAHEHE